MNRCETCRHSTAVIDQGRVVFYRCALRPVWKVDTQCRIGKWEAK